MRSPDGAQRNPGSFDPSRFPDFAALHPGYEFSARYAAAAVTTWASNCSRLDCER